MLPQRTLLVGGNLLLLSAGAFLSAQTVNQLIATRFAESAPRVRIEAPHPVAKAALRPRSWYSPITERDVFNPPREVVEAPAAPTLAALNGRLLGVAPGQAIDSYAIIEDGTTRRQDLYRIGDRFQERTLANVAWDQVILEHGGKQETLRLVQPGGGASPSSPAAIATAPSGGGITALSDTNYVIDRAEVDKAMENLNQLFTQIRAVPHFQDGKANGFRLFAIRRDSIFEKIGLKNGDVLSSINGNPLTDPARAMSLLQELRDQPSVQVEVARNRQPVTLSYEVR